MIGTTVSHYEILEKLGEGGMGVVYKARDRKLKRMVALKFLPAYASQDADTKQRFTHEAQAASALDHPNIGTIHEINQANDGRLFIAMAYYAGDTLKARIARGVLPVEEALDLVIQMAKGLGHAHEAGIVHRDIKPANVIVTKGDRSSSYGRVKIVDFGLAKMQEVQLTKSGTTMGTVSYMSPEQASGAEVDHRSDLWSLGVVFYEMLTGERPFKGDYDHAVMYAILNETHVPVETLRPDLPASVTQAVEKLLKKDPEDRYQTAGEFINELTHAKPASEEPVYALTSRRGSMRMYAGALAIIAIMLIAIGYSVFQPTDETSQQVTIAELPSLAVIPFKNYAENNSNDFFTEGMTLELITTLAKLDGLRTRSLRSVMEFKESEAPLPEIAASLAVDYIVDGAVLVAEGNVRITVNLIEGTTDEPIWGESFTREQSNVMVLQQEIARAIAQAIELELTPEDETRLGTASAVDPEALDNYYKGLQSKDRGDRSDNLGEAIKYYEQAIAIDSTFARAYAAMTVPLLESVSREKAQWAAEKAIELDETLPEAHIAMGVVLTRYREWEKAENHIKRAIVLNSNSSMANYEYYWLLRRKGQFEEALKYARRARDLDPLSREIHEGYAGGLYYNRLYDQVIELGSSYIAESLLAKGDVGEAIDVMEELRVHERYERGDFFQKLAFTGYAYAKAERSQEAMRVLGGKLTKWEEQDRRSETAAGIAIINVGLSNDDEALKWLERAIDSIAETTTLRAYDFEVLPSMSHFVFDDLRDHPRFQQALNKLKVSLRLE